MAMTGLSLKATAAVTAGSLQSGDKRPYRSTAQKCQVSQLACVSDSHEDLRSASMRHLAFQRSSSSTAGRITCAQDLAEQMKEMRAAEKRWEQQVKEGKVKQLTAKEAGYAMQLNGYTFLDVRPSNERNKAYVKASVHVPMYEVDKSLDPATLLRKFSNFTMGGWWNGLPVMKYNERFMPDVVAKIPKTANIIVGCQKGLRSLSACERLYKAGYRNLFWLNGGLDAAQEGDLEREGPQPFNFGGIGGISEFIGWTDVQRLEAKKQGLGYRVALFSRLLAVVLAADLTFVGAQQLSRFFSELRH